MDVFDYEQFLENEIDKLDDDSLDQSVSLENIFLLSNSDANLSEENQETDELWRKFACYDNDINFINEIEVNDGFDGNNTTYSRTLHEADVMDLMEEMLCEICNLGSNEVYLTPKTKWKNQLETESINYHAVALSVDNNDSEITTYSLLEEHSSQPLNIIIDEIDSYFEPLSFSIDVLDENLPVGTNCDNIVNSENLVAVSAIVETNNFATDII